MRKLLLCGLDYSGKTTLIKKFKSSPIEENTELIQTTAYMNLEKITLPKSSTACLVYDMSG